MAGVILEAAIRAVEIPAAVTRVAAIRAIPAEATRIIPATPTAATQAKGMAMATAKAKAATTAARTIQAAGRRTSGSCAAYSRRDVSVPAAVPAV